MSKVFITGIAGFLGSHIADEFINNGDEVAGNDNLIGGYEDNVPKHAICSSDKARKYLSYKTSVNLSDSIDKVIDYIKSKGPRKFEYNYKLEINNELTPSTWKNKEF